MENVINLFADIGRPARQRDQRGDDLNAERNSLPIVKVFPKWSDTWGALVEANACVRSQCVWCGMQHRVDAATMAVLHGHTTSPVDHLDPCNVVGCHGRSYLLVSSGYGRPWVRLLSDPKKISTADKGAMPCNAVSLHLHKKVESLG